LYKTLSLILTKIIFFIDFGNNTDVLSPAMLHSTSQRTSSQPRVENRC